MRSSRCIRHKLRGSSLLEAVLAMVVLSMLLGSLYSVFASLTRRQADALAEYELTLFARALLDEYVTSHAAMPTNGVYKDYWVWQIVESKQDGISATTHDQYYEFVRVDVSVNTISSRQDNKTLSRIVARRASGQ